MKSKILKLAGFIVLFSLSSEKFYAQSVTCPYPVANQTACNISGTVSFYYFNGSSNVLCSTSPVAFAVTSSNPPDQVDCGCLGFTVVAVTVNMTVPITLTASAPPASQVSAGGCGGTMELRVGMGGAGVVMIP
jgi:hypothetical protein